MPVRKPFLNSQPYYCCKQHFSLNVKTVCNYRDTSMDLDVRWFGSVRGAKVFAYSSINQGLKYGSLPILHKTLITSYCKVPNYLIEDLPETTLHKRI